MTNYPEGQVEFLEAVNNPEDADAGTRSVPFGGELWIEQDDFRERLPKATTVCIPGMKSGCGMAISSSVTDFVKDPATGEITEIHCTYDPTDAQRPANAESEVDHSLGFGSGGDSGRGSAL